MIGRGRSGGLTSAEIKAVSDAYKAGTFTLLASGSVQYPGIFLGASGIVTFDAGAGGTMPALRGTINANTDVIAGQRISSAGPDVFISTISGVSTTGELIILGSRGVPITSVHIGMVGGASQVLSGDTTITLNELVRWDFDLVSSVTQLNLYLYPPRSSGRYIDAQVFGVHL